MDIKRRYELNILRSLIYLSIPTVIEEIMSTLLQYVDTAMVGQLGEKATAAVSTTTTVNWLINSVPWAISVAAVAMISKAVGERDREKARRTSSQIFLLTVISGVTLGIICLVLSPFIPGWMHAAKDIRKEASLYFAIISFPMVFRVINTVMGACIRATEDTKTPMVVTLIENIMNIVLNYLLIYRLNLGVKGAATATAISYSSAGILMFIAYRRKDFLRFKFKKPVFDKHILKETASTAYPVFLTSSANCMGYVVFASIVSSMGTTVFAAHSIAVNAEQLFYISGYGLRASTSTLIGISRGEKDERKFRAVEKTSILITVTLMFFSGILLFIASNPFMNLFTSSKTAADLGAEMLRLISFTEPFYGLMIVLEGIYYGLGKTKYVFVIESISMWAVRILFTYICVNIWSMGLRYVWYCMIADNLCKAIMLSVPFILGKVKFPETSDTHSLKERGDLFGN